MGVKKETFGHLYLRVFVFSVPDVGAGAHAVVSVVASRLIYPLPAQIFPEVNVQAAHAAALGLAAPQETHIYHQSTSVDLKLRLFSKPTLASSPEPHFACDLHSVLSSYCLTYKLGCVCFRSSMETFAHAVHVSLASTERLLREVTWLLPFAGMDMVRM